MNNKGWGLSEMLFCLCILVVALAVAVIMINRNINEFNENIGGNNKEENEKIPNKENDKEEIKDNENEEIKDNENEENKEQSVVQEYKTYKEIENAMITAAQQYQERIYGETLLEGDKISVTIKSLINNSYLAKITDPNNENIECSGYVTFIKENNKVEYNAYLKCDENYTTDGYLERLDATE